MLNVYEQVDRNKRKSLGIIIGFIIFITVVSWVFSEASGYGPSLIGWGLVFSGLISFFSYYWSDKIILSISKARLATRKQDFLLYTITENLCLAARIPKPKLYVINDSAPNAFAAGRDPQHAIVCATSGLLKKLDRTELEGVIAHELSHIKNYDSRLMSIVTILVGLVVLLSDWFLRLGRNGRRDRNQKGHLQLAMILVGVALAVLSPLIANLIKLAISRRREFLADAMAVKITRYPPGLAKALVKISQDKDALEVANRATAHLYISDPLKNNRGQIGWLATMFNTHPPIADRVKALKEMN